MNTKLYIPLFIIAAALVSCKELEIPVYQEKDSVVFFQKKSIEVSLKGNTDPEPEIKLELSLFGPVCDFDRAVGLEFPDSSYVDAKEGVHFDLVRAIVPAGAMKGEVVLKVKQLTEDVPSHTIAINIVNDETFPHRLKDQSFIKLTWSKEFVRPTNQYAWQSWFYFLSTSYSRAYHELLYNYFGPEIEYSGYTNGALRDENTIYKGQNWWFSASRDFYAFVKEHDLANPDTPYMHSSDYEVYNSYLQAVGDGKKVDTPPTILSTLIIN